MRNYKILPDHIQKQLASLNLSKIALQRLEWIDWYYSHGKNAEATCRHYSLSKSVFYRWLNRFDPYCLEKIDSKSKDKRPYNLRQMTTPPEIIQMIINIRLQNPKKSKYKIHLELLENGIKVSPAVIQKVINRQILKKIKLF